MFFLCRLLHSFLKNHKNEKAFPICSTFLVAGKTKEGNLCVTIVNESDLSITCSKFLNITSQHVYSVQKGKSVKDIKILHCVEKEEKKW